MRQALPLNTPQPTKAFRQVSEHADRKRRKPSPRITLRLTEEEHNKLMRLSAGMTMSAFVRQCLFGDDVTPRKVRERAPVENEQALAQVLGLLGQSRIANNLNQIAHQANLGTLDLGEATESEIKEACARIAWIRVKLIEALGLKAGDQG